MKGHKELIGFWEYANDLGKEIKRVRREHRITIEKLAETANLHQNTISSLERGRADIRLISNARIMAVLGCESFEIGETAFKYNSIEIEEYPDFKKILNLSGSTIVYMTGQMIKNERKKQEITLEELSDLTGIHRNTIWNIEKGLINPSLYNLFKIHLNLRIKRMKGSTTGLYILEKK